MALSVEPLLACWVLSLADPSIKCTVPPLRNIPIILGIMATYGNAAMPTPPATAQEFANLVAQCPDYRYMTLAEYRAEYQERYYQGYGVLIFCSIISGLILMLMGLKGLGSLVSKVPHSIVVGFTIGIALTIALT